MRKRYLVITFFITSHCLAQNADTSFANIVCKNFNYDTLKYISCVNTPPGIYAIRFRADKHGNFNNFSPLNDSVTTLNLLFIEAIKNSNPLFISEKMKKGDYLQLFYFNNVSHCNPNRQKDNSLPISFSDSIVDFSKPYEKEMIKILSGELVSIQKSIQNLQQFSMNGRNVILLPPVIIDNNDPKMEKPKAGFWNDTPKRTPTKEQLDNIQKLIQQRKNEKDGMKNNDNHF